jgi:hypothetical protein
MMKPSNATHIIFTIMILAALGTFGACFDKAHAQADPEPTSECWTVDGQLVCVGPGPVSITATPTATLVAPTPEPTSIATPRPMNICAHPRVTCVRMPIAFGGAEVTGDVQ